MKVKVIRSVEELTDTVPVKVGCLLWGTKEIPETYCYLGFIPEDGFYLQMVCMEEHPLCTCEKDQEPVYRDSAMEAFFLFESERETAAQRIYLNFEANANGALMAAYGQDRVYRTFFTKEDMEKFACRAEKTDRSWDIRLRIPIEVLEKVYGPLKLGAGSSFSCNFYKISENPMIEHYASYSPILSSAPDFHLPEYFATAYIED